MKKTFLYYISLFSIVSCTINAQDFCQPECAETCCEPQFYVGADWLFFRTQQEHLGIGSFVDDFPDPTFKHVDSTSVTPTFTADSGFRIHLGYAPCSPWQITLSYTYLPFHSNTLHAAIEEGLTEEHRQFITVDQTTYPIFLTIAGFSSVQAKWYGTLSYVDFDFARELTFCDCFRLRPHIGVRAAWMDQKYLIEGNLFVPGINNSTFSTFNMHEKFKAVGLEGGLFGDWVLRGGCSAVGHIGGSILYSKFNLILNEDGFLGKNGAYVFHVSGSGITYTSIPTLDYFVGLQYDTTIWNVTIRAHVGWEQHVFFNLNQLALTSGNFSTQGLNLGLDIGF